MTTTQSPNELIDEFQYFCRESALNALRRQDLEVRDALLRRQIPPQKVPRLESTYGITVRVGTGLSRHPLQAGIERQIEAAAAFLRDFQIGILGQRTTLFQLYEIELLVDKKVRRSFSYCAGKILIQLQYPKLARSRKYFRYQELLNTWNTGKHLPKKSALRRLWWLFNPIGDFRSNLKSTLILAVQKQILGLDKLLLRFGLLEASESDKIMSDNRDPLVPQNFKQGVIAYLKNAVNEKKLGIDLELVLQSKDDRALLQLLRRYKETLTDPTQIEDIVDVATLTLQEAIREEQSKIDIKMLGFVNVGNYHRIDIDINLSAGYWRKYVEIIPRKNEIKALQFGFVNVYTVDDVTVAPTFHQGMRVDFETAALEKTLREFWEQERENASSGTWLQ